MTSPYFASSKDSIAPETIAAHLNHEPNLPGAEDLDVGLVKQWIKALNTGLRNKEVKFLAPKVLDELRAMDGITAEEAARHQQRHPITRDLPEPIYTWNGDGSLGAKRETSPKSPVKQPSAFEVVGKKKNTKHGKETDLDVKDSDEAGGVKLEDNSDHGESDQAVDDAMAEAKTNAKREKKAAKRARKKARDLEKALNEAKPPVGPKTDDSEDSGNDSDWTQTSWTPFWTSDSE